MLYLDSGYEERVGEVFESQVTRLNTRKDVRGELGARLDVLGQAQARQGAQAHGQARGRARMCSGANG
ncbi:hypothetical protein CDL15_Pgr026425 [Punica granatum]|nr:hypothetical protein CDL15_Pgr026425 [Punica granatum]